MNHGMGFPIPHEDGIVKRRESCTPVTPGKPIPQGSDMIPPNMQGNQVGRENWMDLMGMYINILQEAPNLSSVAQNSNPTGAMAQNGGNQNCKVGLDQNGVIPTCNLGMGQIESIQTCNMGMGQKGGIRNSNVGLGHNGSNQSCYTSVGQNGVIQNYNLGMHQIGGSQNFNMGLVQNGGNCNEGMGQIGGNQNCNIGLGQNGRNPNCNAHMVQNRRIMDCTVGMSPNGGNRNCKAAMGQNRGNSNFHSQGNSSSNRYLSIYDPSNWRDALLTKLLGVNENAASVALNKSTQGLNRPLTPCLSTQVGCGWSQLESPSSMIGKQDQTTSSSQQSMGCNLQLLHVDGFSVPYRPSYNLNSPARSEVDATTSVVSPFQFAPVTPDKRKPLEDHQLPQEVNSVYGSSSNERNEREHRMVSVRSEGNEGHCNEVLPNFVNSSSSAVSTTLQEHLILDEGNEQGFDLNKTPQQKTPKRRKHRPKVVIEGKRTPKPKAPKNSISNDTPVGKRKYVRKIGLKISETQKANGVGKECAEGPQEVGNRKYVRKKILKIPETQEANTVEDVRIPAVEPAAKSCRRALKFDLESTQNSDIQENTGFNQIERKQGSIAGFNLNFNAQDTEKCTELNGVSGVSAVQIRQQNAYIAGTSNQQHLTNQMLLRNSFLPEANAPTTPLGKVKAQALNAIARNVTKRSSIPGHNAQLNEYSQVDRHAYGEGIGQIFFKANAASTDLDRAIDPILQSKSQSFTKDIPHDDGKRGLKRRSIEQIYPHAIDDAHIPFMYQKFLMASNESDDGSNRLGSSHLETHKKKKTHDVFYANISTVPSGSAASKDSPSQEERRGMNGVRANSSISQFLSSCFGGDNISDKEINAGNVTSGNGYSHPMAAKQNIQKHHVSSERQPKQRSQGSTQVHDFNSLTAMVTYQRPTTPMKETAGSDYLGEIWARHANVSEQPQPAKSILSNQLLSEKDQTLQRRHNDAVEGHRILSTTPPKEAPRSDCLTEIRTYQASVLEKKQTPKPCLPRRRGMDKMLENQYNNAVKGHQPSSTKARGTPKKLMSLVSVDEITYRLEGLNICGDSKEKHALVPYKGDNSIVPFEPKKRKTRPKVDLDPESDRLWKFLMGKEGSEGAEAKDKEKWWEEERAVFRGRADSFIARMHLVQGDRRFSRWKGSVVDSVIGVFLTQNVSDHLSSSAFMALAAKFPTQSTTIDETCCQTQVLVEEPDIQVLEHCESIQYQGKIGRQPLVNHSSIVACESTEETQDRRYLTSRVSDAANKHNRVIEEELLSQDSFDSFVLQTTDEQRSSSGSNSEAEDQITGCKPNKNPAPTLINMLHQEGVMFEGFYSHVNGRTSLTERSMHMHHQSEKQECNRHDPRYIGVNNLQSSSGFTGSSNSNIHHMQESLSSFSNFQLKMTADSRKMGEQYGGMLVEESLSSSPSTGSAVTEAYHTVKQTYQQSETRIPQAAPFVKFGFLGKHPTHQGSSQRGTQIGNSAYFMNNQQHLNSKILQLERAYVREPIGPAEILFQRETDARKQGSESSMLRGTNAIAEDRMSVVDRQKHFENTAAEANSKEQTYSSQEPLSAAATNNVKTRKGKVEEEKKRAFDWDSLRKQVLLNGENRERSKDAVDSLNYEALRSADVKKISDAIRERGMNNMLAERMKDFLNRLVRDHGSTDLEWLRDVPPDKAKDYLLSIRGLGLKSVECVRLLTLHHLAFPVDTNVGRIAVRLGWVPLQPLPESLQLHLLELYPVLETIQKYLWPRLCKLDQPTLYELHYQMITFGKVFCTKSKPNCNACPMRAECRHFASAFASARLALPGPEEKGIVPSAVPMADDRKPKVEIKPLALPLSDSNSWRDAGFFNQRCEPIIEEPSTPESETTELLERDIEDAFYEDPDEIPTIKLNMEEFTMNLHNLMQDNMELQGDMSKALVALNPEAASIPTPKLKNVSRLRTEHQVYELPDSHPLLERLDKRERDDPSPYLLAIWTPGETANSVQPPESTCQAQESGNLCNDNTCFSCNSTREANSLTVRGTILVPCRTAMRGSFPLNGTYFQVNEMFADHESSLNPIDVPRSWLWNLPRRTVFFGTSVSTIFKGLTTEEIQFCFWRGFVCVRGFDQQSRAPRPLMARLHFPASKLVKKKEGK